MNLVIAAGGETLQAFDPADPDWATPLWMWTRKGWTANDVRVRKDTHGSRYALACGGGKILVISFPHGEVLQAVDTDGSVHSADLLPKGVLVGAAPGGDAAGETDSAGAVKVYRSHLDQSLRDWSDKLFDAHGVLWDEHSRTLWAVGRNKGPKTAGGTGILRKYAWRGLREDPPLQHVRDFPLETDPRPLDRISRHFAKWPGYYEAPHDIAPVPGTRNFHVSTDLKVVTFDANTETFAPAPGEISGLYEVKGLGVHPSSHQIALVRHDRADGGWASERIRFFRPQDTRTGGRGFYKVRWADTDPTWDATVPSALARIVSLRATLLGSNGNARFFGTEHYVECDWDSGERKGNVRSIREVWKGLPKEMLPLDAALLGSNGNPRFFGGGRYLECDWHTGQARKPGVRRIADEWPGLPEHMRGNIRAALLGSNGNARFFGTEHYVECDWKTGRRVGTTRTIREVWKGLPEEMLPLDAALLGSNGNPRFFGGGRYLECDWHTGQARKPGVRRIADVWPGLHQ
ncbi:hypothetical protein [Streptomyces sp. NPDC021096]|uniref:hypothetical protein n=1 Tax=Streptomyces sp. NPDC021096 TaxID=3154792 RepID=UPI0033D4129E